MLPLNTTSAVLAALLLSCVTVDAIAAQEPVKAPPPVAKKPAEPPERVDPEPELTKEHSPAMAAAYSRDGKRFALALRGANEVRVYDAVTWQVLHTLDVGKQMCFGLQFSADGGTLYAAGYDGPIRTFDTKTGKAGQTLDAKAGSCTRVVLSPDGKTLASGHYDSETTKGAIHLWDTATGKVVHALAADEPLLPNAMVFTPDGKTVAGGYHAGHKKVPDETGFHGVIEWDAATGKERKRYDTPRVTPGAHPIACAVAYSKDGAKLILGGGEAVPIPRQPGSTMLHGYLWVIDRKTGEVEKTLVSNRSDYVRSLAMSADGKRLFVPADTLAARALPPNVNPNNVPRVFEFHCFDTTTWEVEWTTNSREPGLGMELAVSPDGKRIGIGGSGGFGLFDAQTGEAKGGLLKRQLRRK
jgi:WD40 repeat protein